MSGRLARWILLLEVFDYTVEYKAGCMHLSRLSEDMGSSPIDDRLIDDNMFIVTASPYWYARIVEFLTTQQLSGEYTKEDRRTVKVNNRHFAVVGHRLFRRGANGLLKMRVSKVEVPTILVVCHDSVCGGHFSSQLTCQKIVKAGYFWPTLFKDAHDYAKKCDACQR